MASGLLQLPEVQNACCQYLAKHLHPCNCLGIVHFAEHHDCSELYQEACSYAWQNFSMVVKSDEFLNLTHPQVISLIGSNELGVSSEEDVFEAVCSWVKRDRFVITLKCLYFELQYHLYIDVLYSSVSANTVEPR